MQNMVRTEERAEYCMAAKDNRPDRAGVGSVMIVHADIKVAWMCITSLQKNFKKRAANKM